jgi:hypothetical protein
MKFLVIGLSGADPEQLFTDERLENVRRLMDGGCYGRLQGSTAHFPLFQSILTSAEWEWIQYAALSVPRLAERLSGTASTPGNACDYTCVDAALGRLLEQLDADTGVLVIAHDSAGGEGITAAAFILASPSNVLQGDLGVVDAVDLAPTVLELAGHALPGSLRGQSLVAGKVAAAAAVSESDEELIRARLRGLGYIE